MKILFCFGGFFVWLFCFFLYGIKLRRAFAEASVSFCVLLISKSVVLCVGWDSLCLDSYRPSTWAAAAAAGAAALRSSPGRRTSSARGNASLLGPTKTKHERINPLDLPLQRKKNRHQFKNIICVFKNDIWVQRQDVHGADWSMMLLDLMVDEL